MDKTNFDVIKEFVELYANDLRALKSVIGNLYALTLKGITKRKDRNIKILLTDIQALGRNNQPYCEWQDNYNYHDVPQYDDFLANDENYGETIKEMKGILKNGKKNKYKRAKKLTSRIYKDIKKVCSTYKISPSQHKDFCVALRVGFFAYREAIINVRHKLHKDSYLEIPNDLHIYKDGKKLIIKDLYKEYEINNLTYYRLDSEIKFTKEELSIIQLAIYPYIFKKVYKTIRF